MSASGKFRKARVKPMRRYGTYRGAGWLDLHHERGVKIEGKRVKPPLARVGIAVGFMFAVALVTRGQLFLGAIPLYLLVEYAILDPGNCSLSWLRIVEHAHDPEKQLISFRVDDWPKGRETVVFRSDRHTELAEAFSRALPDARAPIEGGS